MRRLLFLLAPLLLAGCEHGPVPNPLLGKTETQLRTCLGEPAQRQGIGTAEVLTFHIRTDSGMVPPGDSICSITVELANGTVRAVTTADPTMTGNDGAACNGMLERCR